MIRLLHGGPLRRRIATWAADAAWEAYLRGCLHGWTAALALVLVACILRGFWKRYQ
jgi:hypothetical protein